MPTTTRPTLAHEALAAYGIAHQLVRLCEKRLVPGVVEKELDEIGERIAAVLGCNVQDLTREKGERNGKH